VVEDQVGEGGDHPLEVRSNGKNRGDTGAPDKRKPRAICGAFRGALGRTRTCDLLIRRPNHAVLCGSLKCVWAFIKHFRYSGEPACSILFPSRSRQRYGCRSSPGGYPSASARLPCSIRPTRPSQTSPRSPPPSAGPGTTTHELVGYNRDTTELYMRHFYDHWVGNKDSVRPKAFEAIVDTFARPDAIKASFG
jgi:hypothetical protein